MLVEVSMWWPITGVIALGAIACVQSIAIGRLRRSLFCREDDAADWKDAYARTVEGKAAMQRVKEEDDEDAS